VSLAFVFLGAALSLPVANAFGQAPTRPADAKVASAKDSPLHACDDRTRAIRLLEVRSMGRIEEDLALVDGINIDRDVLVIACRSVIWDKFSGVVPKGKRVFVHVRAWRKPPDSGWRDVRLNEPTLREAIRSNPTNDPEGFGLEDVNLAISATTVGNPTLVIPLRRDAVKAEDLIRIRIQVGPETEPALAGERQAAAAGPPEGQAAGTGDASGQSSSTAAENEELIDTVFAVGRFGLHARFSDMALFVQRLGEDRANSTGTNPVVFDSVNFRPAPGVNYGFNYYHRRHASIRVLEPGFGLHIVFLNWNDRPRGSSAADTEITQVTNLQIGIGLTGSMFDGTVVGALGWNLQVKDQRPYVAIGFSITGLARKIAQFVRD
jgi:hypothetical protein